MQRFINNFHSIIIYKIINETLYDFIFLQFLNMLRQFVTIDFIDDLKKSFAKIFFNIVVRVRFEIVDVITFAQMNNEYYYNRKHQFLFIKLIITF